MMFEIDEKKVYLNVMIYPYNGTFYFIGTNNTQYQEQFERLKDLNSRKTEEGRVLYNEYITDIYEGDLNNITKEIDKKEEQDPLITIKDCNGIVIRIAN